MKWRRRLKTSTGRQRPQSDLERQPVSQNLSYSSSRSDALQNTGRVKQRAFLTAAGHRARRFWLQRFGLLILLVAFIISAINVLLLSTTATVVPLNATGSAKLVRPLREYEAAAAEALQQSWWNRNKLTVDTAQITRELQARFPELDSVSLTLPLLAHRPLLYIQTASPGLILANADGAYLLNDSGKAILKASGVSELQQPSLPVVTDQNTLSLKVGEAALPADDVSFIKEVIAQLAAKGFQVETLNLPTATNQLDVRLAGQGYTVKFNLQAEAARQQAGTFLATIDNLKQQNITPSQYVDVRVEGRAYYQ